MNEGKQLLLVSQKQADLEEPTVDDVFDVGTIANIIQLLKLPDGTVKVLVEGQQRAKINQLNDGEDHFSAEVTPIETTFGDEKELDVVKAAVLNEFESYLQLNKKIPADVLGALQRIDDADRLADTMAAHIPVTVRHKQSVLELADVQERLEYLLGMMESEADILQVEKTHPWPCEKNKWRKASVTIILANKSKQFAKKWTKAKAKIPLMKLSNFVKRLKRQVCQQMCVTKWKVSYKNSK